MRLVSINYLITNHWNFERLQYNHSNSLVGVGATAPATTLPPHIGLIHSFLSTEKKKGKKKNMLPHCPPKLLGSNLSGKINGNAWNYNEWEVYRMRCLTIFRGSNQIHWTKQNVLKLIPDIRMLFMFFIFTEKILQRTTNMNTISRIHVDTYKNSKSKKEKSTTINKPTINPTPICNKTQ